MVPAGAGSGRETSTNASCQELLQNLTPQGTPRPPGKQQGEGRKEEGEGFWLGPNLGLCPKAGPCCHRAKALPGFLLYC